MNRKRGFTLIELLTVMAIIALLVGLLLPALAQARAKAQLTKDQTQLKQIHAAWATFAREYNGLFPTPGIVNRMMDQDMGREVPGRGPEDILANDSAAMYSLCIMQNYFTPQILVGPTEASGFVAVKDDYCWEAYSPVEDYYWDTEGGAGPAQQRATSENCPQAYIPFAVFLDRELHSTGELICNTSYAHPPIFGDRKSQEWRDTLNSKWGMVSNRGVRNGDDEDPEVYESSVTLQFHGGRKEWVGNVCYNDNHVALHRTFFPEGVTYLDPDSQEPETLQDNLFRNDSEDGNDMTGDGVDVWLTLTSEIQTIDGDIVTEWD